MASVIQSQWDVEARSWENVMELWGLLDVFESVEKKGGRALEEYIETHGQEAINEDLVKVFVKVYNNFLTEKQDPLVQAAKSFPIYKQEKLLKKKKDKPVVMMEGLTIGFEPNVYDNIQQAADKLLEYVRAN